LECLIIAGRRLIKMFNKRGPRLNPYVTHNNKQKGEENFPKIRMKEDLFDK
jgi:hypothetical protein